MYILDYTVYGSLNHQGNKYNIYINSIAKAYYLNYMKPIASILVYNLVLITSARFTRDDDEIMDKCAIYSHIILLKYKSINCIHGRDQNKYNIT